MKRLRVRGQVLVGELRDVAAATVEEQEMESFFAADFDFILKKFKF